MTKRGWYFLVSSWIWPLFVANCIGYVFILIWTPEFLKSDPISPSKKLSAPSPCLYTRKWSSAFLQALIKRGMTPGSQSVFLSFVAVYRPFHPSIHPCLHPSHRQVSDQSSKGYFLHLHPSAMKEQGMMTDNNGSRRIPTHTTTHVQHTVCRPSSCSDSQWAAFAF